MRQQYASSVPIAALLAHMPAQPIQVAGHIFELRTGRGIAGTPLQATRAIVEETAHLGIGELVAALRAAKLYKLPSAPPQEVVYLQVPHMLANGGRFWLQAEHGSATSTPFVLPAYSGPAKQAGVNQQQGMWKRFMYPLCASRQACWPHSLASKPHVHDTYLPAFVSVKA